MKKAWVLSYPLSAQRRLWSDWASESSLGAHSFCWFCHVAAHFVYGQNTALSPQNRTLVLRNTSWKFSICGTITLLLGVLQEKRFYLCSVDLRTSSAKLTVNVDYGNDFKQPRKQEWKPSNIVVYQVQKIKSALYERNSEEPFFKL